MSAKQCYSTECHSRLIVRGEASDDELAALTAVFAALTVAEPVPPATARSAWADPAYVLCLPLRPGPAAWRFSTRAH